MINSPRLIALVRPRRRQNRQRLKANFLNGFKLIGVSGAGLKILLSENQKTRYLPHIPLHKRGRFAIVTKRGAGCDGRGGAVDEWC